MTWSDLVALLPIIILGVASVVLVLVLAVIRPRSGRAGHRGLLAAAATASAGLVLAFLSLLVANTQAPRQVTPLLVVDGYALFYTGLILAASLVVVFLAYGYLQRQNLYGGEFYLLLLMAVLGSTVLVASQHFASFFLGLEILSVSLYALIAFPRTRRHGIEAGIKYLVLAAASAAFLLFGMALVYADQGTMAFDSLVLGASQGAGPMLLAGVAMMVVGIGFKLAVVPFHLWTPDVYEGAPVPVTAFIATVSKGGVFALLLRLAVASGGLTSGPIYVVLAAVAIASMFFGNLLALRQRNVKRLLAYSSIGHLGYLLVALLAGGGLAVTAATFYLVAYFVTTLAAFGVVTVLSGPGRDADSMEDYRGLYWRRPALAAIFTVSLLSLIGIPLTAGFVGKFLVLAAGVGSARWWLVVSLVISSAVGLYYYLRVIVAMFLEALPLEERGPAPPALSLAGGVVLGLLGLALLVFGLYPTALVQFIESAVARFI